MATCFSITLPTFINRTAITMKSMSCTSRQYFRSDSTSLLFKQKINRCYQTEPTLWLAFRPSCQKLSYSHSAIFRIGLIKLTGVSNFVLKKTYATESDNNTQFNVKNSEYNKVVPTYPSSSSVKLASSKSVPSCPVLCPMCHGNIGYCCNDKTISDIISLKSVSIAAEPTAELRQTETENTTENRVEKDELSKIIPNFEPLNTWPSKPATSSTGSQRLIVCPMCHRHLVHGIRNSEKRSYRAVPTIANQTKAKVKHTTGINLTLKRFQGKYNKVIPKCPENETCPSSPTPCPPCPCNPCPCYPPFPCCPPPCPSCPPPCPSCPPCDPCQCPQCPSDPSEPKCPS